MSLQKKHKKRSVAGVIFNKKRDKILIIQRLDVPVWVLPGGGVDPEETFEEAIIREVYEETGLIVKVYRKVAEYSPINRLAYPTYLFECAVIGGQISKSDETSDIGFFPINALPKSFFFLHQEWLRDALENKKEIIKKKLSAVSYTKLMKFMLIHPYLVFRFFLTCLRSRS